jgi:CBS domain containing-hemolysin-like protein
VAVEPPRRIVAGDAVIAAADYHYAWPLLGLLSVPALVALNGFFVAAEFSLVAIRRTKVEELVRKNVRGAHAVAEATNNLDRSIAATQLGITLASIALGWIGERALAGLMEPLFGWLPGVWAGVTAHGVAVAVAFTFITFMHVVFGELVPKTVALQSVDRTSLWVAQPLLVFYKLSWPLIALMNGAGNRIVRLIGFRPAHGAELMHSVEELALLIEDTEEAGILEEEQADIVQNVFLLSNKTVRDCMVPRDKIASLDIHMAPDDILHAVRDGAHTRMPVYDGTLDNIVGIVNTKDLFYLFSLRGVVVLEDAIYPATYLEADETVAKALKLFKKSRKPMALVRNGGGQILGMVTLEDVIEEIVGDIEDEHDRPTRRLRLKRFRRPSPPAARVPPPQPI